MNRDGGAWMQSVKKSINSCLNKMGKVSPQDKGVYGELAAFTICEEIYQRCGGLLYHSYAYKVDPALPGNIKSQQGVPQLYIENLGNFTEIDILLVTPHRIFPIEVKAYKSKKITLTDSAIAGCAVTNKSPIHQHEMHCRHLYSGIYSAIPQGKVEYIVPVVTFVDECKVVDIRSIEQRRYIYCSVLNSLKQVIAQYNTPSSFALDLDAISRVLKSIMITCEKELPLRRV